MRPVCLFVAPSASLFLTALPALAHGGHVGDLAGHSHWLGWAAVAGAAALAGLLAKGRKRAEKDAAEPSAGEEDRKGAEA